MFTHSAFTEQKYSKIMEYYNLKQLFPILIYFKMYLFLSAAITPVLHDPSEMGLSYYWLIIIANNSSYYYRQFICSKILPFKSLG